MSSQPIPKQGQTPIRAGLAPVDPGSVAQEQIPGLSDVAALLRQVVEAARALSGAAAAAILLYDPEQDLFLPSVASGLDERWLLRQGLEAAQALARRAAHDLELVALPDPSGLGALDLPPLAGGGRPSAVWAAPLAHDGRVVGVLQLYHGAPHPAPLSAEAMNAFTALASSAIVTAQAHAQERSRRSRLEVLDGASKALAGEFSLHQLLQRIVDLAVRLAGARYGALGVAGEDGFLTDFITSGLTPEERARIGPLPRGHGLLGVLIREGKSLRVADIGRDPRRIGFPPHHPPMTSLLGVPIQVHEQVVGDLYLTDKIGAPAFSAEDQHLIELLAAHAGIAIENARLHDREQQARQALQQALDSLRFLVETDVVLASSLDCQATLHNLARQAVPYLADWCSVVMLGEDGGIERVAVAHMDQAKEAPLQRLHRGVTLDSQAQGGLARVLRTGQPEIVPTVTEADLAILAHGYAEADTLALLAPTSYMIVPLVSRGQTMGAIICARVTPGTSYEQSEVLVAEDLARRAALAVANAQLHAQVGEVTRLRERERISRELHDGIIQDIYGVTLQLEDVAEDLQAGPQQERLLGLVDALSAVIGDIRTYIQGLRARELDGRLLAEGVASLVREVEGRTDLALHFVLAGEPYRLPDTLANTLLQVTREALANVVKHARAQRVQVGLTYGVDEMLLEVADDGQGFDPQQIVGADHHGLRNLHGRAVEIGGALQIQSRPGAGTTLTLRMPAPPMGDADRQ